MIHIEGMGVLGSLLALRLDYARLPFTWHDTEVEQTAWRACTGAIYPSGAPDSVDAIGYARWDDWLDDGSMKRVYKHFESADYVFNHAKPPHEGRYLTRRDEKSGLGIASVPSFHVNAQGLVPAVRKLFADRRRSTSPHRGKGDVFVQAHGWGGQRTHAYWGWTALVTLSHKFKMGEFRPAFYFRKGKFVMAYAYPVPGTPYWYAGSSLIKQTKLKELDVQSKFDRWKEWFQELSGGAVKVVGAPHAFIQGWRPAMHEPQVQMERGKIILPSLWNSGVRHAPYYIDQVLERLRANHR